MKEAPPPKGPDSTIPPDDLRRKLTVAQTDDEGLTHVSVAGDTYTILITGAETAGRYCLIDMVIPPGGGPPPHRHDFEEMFTILDGELEFVFRGEKSVIREGGTVNIPANAPHSFRNASGRTARILCMGSPAGLDEFFLKVGDIVASRNSPPPVLDEAGKKERLSRVLELAPRYRTEILAGPG
jgi:quercetin dioxygenase-like cupin family protein